MLERFENGQFVGFLEKIDTAALLNNATGGVVADLHAAMAAGAREKAGKSDPIAADIAALSRRLREDSRRAVLKFEYREKPTSSRRIASPALAAMELEIAGLKAEEDEIKRETDRQVAKKNEIDAAIRKNVAVFRTAAGPSRRIALADIVRDYQPNAMGIPAKAWHYAVKIRELLFDDPRESNTEGGLFPAIFGTVMLVFLMAFSCSCFRSDTVLAPARFRPAAALTMILSFGPETGNMSKFKIEPAWVVSRARLSEPPEGLTLPPLATVTVPATLPVPPSVAPLLTLTAPAPLSEPLTNSAPALIVVAPL